VTMAWGPRAAHATVAAEAVGLMLRLRTTPSGEPAYDVALAYAEGLPERVLASDLAEEAVIATPTCPLRPLVRELPEAAEIDRGMWAGLVEVALRDTAAAAVQCETQDCLDDHASCRVRLRLRSS